METKDQTAEITPLEWAQAKWAEICALKNLKGMAVAFDYELSCLRTDLKRLEDKWDHEDETGQNTVLTSSLLTYTAGKMWGLNRLQEKSEFNVKLPPPDPAPVYFQTPAEG